MIREEPFQLQLLESRHLDAHPQRGAEVARVSVIGIWQFLPNSLLTRDTGRTSHNSQNMDAIRAGIEVVPHPVDSTWLEIS